MGDAEAEEVEWRVKGENTPLVCAGIFSLTLCINIADFKALFNINCTSFKSKHAGGGLFNPNP